MNEQPQKQSNTSHPQFRIEIKQGKVDRLNQKDARETEMLLSHRETLFKSLYWVMMIGFVVFIGLVLADLVGWVSIGEQRKYAHAVELLLLGGVPTAIALAMARYAMPAKQHEDPPLPSVIAAVLKEVSSLIKQYIEKH